MGKPKKTGQVAKNANSNQIKYEDPTDAFLSTKSSMVVGSDKSLEISLVYGGFNIDALSDSIVVAKDKLGYYVTGQSFVDAPVLDPFRQYHREKISVNAVENGFEIINNNNKLMFTVSAI
jgi:hypothetical protein